MNTTLIGGSPAGEARYHCKWWNPGPGQVWAAYREESHKGIYVGCCSTSSQASRSTYTRHTPIPVSHPLGWEEPASCSRENRNIQVQEASHQETLLGSTFLAVNTLHLPLGRMLTPEWQTFHPGVSKGSTQAGITKQLRRAQWKDRFTEFTFRGTVDKTKRPPCLQFQVLEPSIGPEGLAKCRTKSG